MAHAAPAALGVYQPRRPQASPLFRLVRIISTACRASTTSDSPVSAALEDADREEVFDSTGRLVQPVPGEAEPDIAVGALLVQREEAGG